MDSRSIVALTYYKDDLVADDVIDCALLGICSNENKSSKSRDNNAVDMMI